MERRKRSPSKATGLPPDYLKMVNKVFTSHFKSGLEKYEEHVPSAHFETFGEIFNDEIVLCVSLMNQGHLAATTVYASTDFDPQSKVTTAQELLNECVDAIGGVFSSLLSPDKPENIARLAEESLAALENVPFKWTTVQSNKRQIFVKIDKTNPALDSMADEWLRSHN